jgi:hypothetical protein
VKLTLLKTCQAGIKHASSYSKDLMQELNKAFRLS